MRIHRSSLIFVAVSFVFALNCFGQSLADVARQERARQKATKSRVTIIAGRAVSGTLTQAPTPAAPAANTSASTAPAPAIASAVKPVEPRDKNGHDEKYWRDTFQKARADARRSDDVVTLLELRVRDLNVQYLRQSDVYNRENLIGSEINSAQKELEDARKQADQAKQRLIDLEDELRKAGGPPGWAR
jgi:hypothetical protein